YFGVISGHTVLPFNLSGQCRRARGTASSEMELNADRLQLDPLLALAQTLPIDPTWQAQWTEGAVQGRLEKLQAQWQGKPVTALRRSAAPPDFLQELQAGCDFALPAQHYRVQTRFVDLGLHPTGARPGFSGLSGEVRADQASGSLSLASRSSMLRLPSVFE